MKRGNCSFVFEALQVALTRGIFPLSRCPTGTVLTCALSLPQVWGREAPRGKRRPEKRGDFIEWGGERLQPETEGAEWIQGRNEVRVPRGMYPGMLSGSCCGSATMGSSLLSKELRVLGAVQIQNGLISWCCWKSSGLTGYSSSFSLPQLVLPSPRARQGFSCRHWGNPVTHTRAQDWLGSWPDYCTIVCASAKAGRGSADRLFQWLGLWQVQTHPWSWDYSSPLGKAHLGRIERLSQVDAEKECWAINKQTSTITISGGVKKKNTSSFLESLRL